MLDMFIYAACVFFCGYSESLYGLPLKGVMYVCTYKLVLYCRVHMISCITIGKNYDPHIKLEAFLAYLM